MQADLLVIGGVAFDARWGAPRRVGIAVHGDRILCVDRDEALASLRGPRTEVLDLAGGLVTAGMHDAHAHISEGGIARCEPDLRPARSVEDLLELVAARAHALPPGAAVTGRGWDERRFLDPTALPSAAALDRACPDRPVLLRRVCGHAAVANARMLALAGFGAEAPDPPEGSIERDARGAPTGMLYEAAIDVARRALPPPGADERRLGVLTSLAEARRFGLTSVEDERGWIDTYEALIAEDALTARVRVWGRLETPLDELVTWRESFPAGAWVRPGLLKGYLDGSLGARTALFFEPYADRPETCGLSTFDPERLARLVIDADAAGFQVGLHAIGDRAVARALDAFEAAARAHRPRGMRHRVEHAQHVRLTDVPRFAALGAVASMQPSHLASDLGMVEPRLGPARLGGAYAWRSMLAAGAAVAFGSDYPIETIDPRTSLYAACTRMGWQGEGPLAPASEAVTLAQALAAFTTGSAWAAHQESEKGLLEPGFPADLTLWQEDLFRLPAADLLHAPLAATIVAGHIVWRAP